MMIMDLGKVFYPGGLMQKPADKGVSELISVAILVLITTVAMAIALLVGTPVINKAKESAVFNEAVQNMKIIDNIIKEVSSEGRGSFRAVQLKITDGEYKINQKTNTIEFTDIIKTGILTPGTFVKEGNVFISAGVNAKASKYDLNLDGVSDLVLENEIMRVAILNNATAGNGINTSRALQLFNLKENGANITINDSSVTIENRTESYYGTGFTELVRENEHLPVAEAIIHVNTSAPINLTYDIIYTLRSGADFLLVKIQNISDYFNSSNIPTFVKFNLDYRIGSSKTDDAYDIGTINETVGSGGISRQFLTSHANLTNKYACSFDRSLSSDGLLLSLVHSGKSDRLDYINFTSVSGASTYSTSIRQKIIGSNLIIPFTKVTCKAVSDNFYLVAQQDIPSRPFASYNLGGEDIPIQIYVTYDRLQINGTDRFSAGSHKICFSNDGVVGGTPRISVKTC